MTVRRLLAILAVQQENGHYDNRTGGQKKRSEAVKNCTCKCPAGQSC